MGINTSKTFVHNIFDEQIIMAKKNYESYLKMMGLEIANPSYPKNSVVIELMVNDAYCQTDFDLLDFINMKVGSETKSYAEWVETIIINTCSTLPKTDNGTFDRNKIEVKKINFLDLTEEMRISYYLNDSNLTITDDTMGINKGLKLKILITFKKMS